MREFEIDERTAQLIFDAIAWCNRDWMDALEWDNDEYDILTSSRGDFKRFCAERGITSIKVSR